MKGNLMEELGVIFMLFIFLVVPIAMSGLAWGVGMFLLWGFVTYFTEITPTTKHFLVIWFVSTVGVYFYFFGVPK